MKTLFATMIGVASLLTGSTAIADLTKDVPVAPGGVPSLLMVRVYAADMARAEQFYEETLGLHIVSTQNPREHVLMFPGGNGPGILILQGEPLVPQANGSFVIRVADVDATVARAKEHGARILRPAEAGPYPGTRDALLNDYDGSLIEITSIAPRKTQ